VIRAGFTSTSGIFGVKEIKIMNKRTKAIFNILILDQGNEVPTSLAATLSQNSRIQLKHFSEVDAMLDLFKLNYIPNLILLDAGFGGGLVYTIISYIKLRCTPKPFIVLIEYFGMTPLTFALIAGCDEVICKPVHADELLAVLKKVERNHESKELEK
jgi:DNA-binding response OmpR family regulator